MGFHSETRRKEATHLASHFIFLVSSMCVSSSPYHHQQCNVTSNPPLESYPEFSLYSYLQVGRIRVTRRAEKYPNKHATEGVVTYSDTQYFGPPPTVDPFGSLIHSSQPSSSDPNPPMKLAPIIAPPQQYRPVPVTSLRECKPTCPETIHPNQPCSIVPAKNYCYQQQQADRQSHQQNITTTPTNCVMADSLLSNARTPCSTNAPVPQPLQRREEHHYHHIVFDSMPYVKVI